MIHRSLLFDSIYEWRQSLLKEESLLVQILKALQVIEGSNHDQGSSEKLVDGKDEERSNKESSENLFSKKEEANNDETKDPTAKQDTDARTEEVSKIVAVLEKIEHVFREQRDDLLEANQDFKDPGVAKVGKMVEKIQKVKENLGTKEKRELQLLDQPNAQGYTALHITTKMDDMNEATRMLLNHGANPNVQDSESEGESWDQREEGVAAARPTKRSRLHSTPHDNQHGRR